MRVFFSILLTEFIEMNQKCDYVVFGLLKLLV